MGRFVADWILGDTLRKLEYTVLKADGTPFDLTGYTVTLLGRRQSDAAGSAPISRSGALSGAPTDGVATFSDLTAGLAPAAEREAFECRVKLVNGALVGYTEPFELGVRRWP